jgi:NAD-dependent dihydropyrimidine dehydrogenase PreA subunit
VAIIIDDEKCTTCGACTDCCPVTALAIENEKLTCSDDCIDCGVCADQCPTEALSLP